MSKFYIGVDVTRSIWVEVEADNEEQAGNLAKVQAELDSTVGEGSWVSSEVHFVDDITEVDNETDS